MFQKKTVIISVLIVFIFLPLSSCDLIKEQSFIKFFKANVHSAAPGDQILLEWEYSNPNQLENQHLELITLNLDGSHSTDILSAENFRTDYIFVFKKPVTVSLVATAEDGRVHRAALTIFQVDQHLTMDIFSLTPQLPYLPYIPKEPGGGCNNIVVYEGSNGRIEFSDIVAFYDENSNGFADGFAEGGLLSNEEFFRGSTSEALNDSTFSFVQGSKYPGKIYQDPDQDPANFIVYGQKIITDGTPQEYKTQDDNPGTAYIEAENYRTIFTAILFQVKEYGGYRVVDIQLGNFQQGLILAAYHPDLEDTTYISDSPEFDWLTIDGRDIADGQIKSARVGYPRVNPNGEDPNVYVDLSEIDFLLPIHPDDDLAFFLE